MGENITGKQAPNGARTILADVVPLNTPLVVQIFDIYGCNLACKFCHFGLPREERPKVTEKNLMDFDLFCKIIDDMKEFPQKIKMLRFCGDGESLLDPNLIPMIEYVMQSQVAEKVELITNGILMTPEMSERILDAGLERVKFSIYGISSAQYEDICQRAVDFDMIVDNVKQFYELRNRKNKSTRVYVKTMDCCLHSEADEEEFVRLFSKYCDVYAVEKVRPSVTGIDYSQWLDGDQKYNTAGMALEMIKVCPLPYHLITIRPDGKVVPCQKANNETIGDCNESSLVDIWNGTALREMQKKMLDGHECCGELCKECNLAQSRPFPEDVLDHEVERLKKIFI